MEPIGFGLAIIAEARTLAYSIERRVKNYRKGPQKFAALIGNVDRLARHITEVEALLQKFPSAVPTEISVIFHETFGSVRDILQGSNRTMEQCLRKPFEDGGSSVMDKICAKALRFFRASAIISKMADVEAQIKEASNQLVQLTLALGSALKFQEHRDEVVPIIKNLNVGGSSNDMYRRRINAPRPSSTVHLDFNSRDESGRPTTLEGLLKESVLSTDSSSTVTMAAGAMECGYGIVGMAGVGKSVALQGLAYDSDVGRRFPDGVLFMRLGQGAYLESVLGELATVLAGAGATRIAESVKGCKSVREAVDIAVPWFEGRKCLFLFDDVWGTKSCKTGFLTDLQQLLRESPESRIAISTRSVEIARYAGCKVDFGARDPLGIVSEKIFMAHATRGVSGEPSEGRGSKRSGSVEKILSICSGLPIALAVTGSGVAFLTSMDGNFGRACDTYASRLEKKRRSVGDEKTMEGTSLNAGIALSLEFLEAEFATWKAKCSQDTTYSIRDLYTSLCILQNHSWIPVSALGRLWKVDEDFVMDVAYLFCGMSLATLDFRCPANGCAEEAGIVLHDLHLGFCQGQAVEMKTTSQWHAQLLNGYVEAAKQRVSEEPNTEVSVMQKIVSFNPRRWWSKAVLNDGYIHENVSRHLVCGGQGIELAALLLDGRWTVLRGSVGGILGLRMDFKVLEKFLEDLESLGVHLAVGEVGRSFEHIFSSVFVSWGWMANKGPRAFQFHVCGSLLRMRKSNYLVDAYLKSLETSTPKPVLIPVSPIFPDLTGAQIMTIPVGFCLCVTCSPCGRYIAAGAGGDIVVANGFSGEILRRLQGHSYPVTYVTFAAGSKKIVSGSSDGAVIIREWESSGSPMRVLHVGRLHGVALSGDGNKIFSISGGTVKIWDAATGAKMEEIVQKGFLECIAVCGVSEKIALGFSSGIVSVVDGVSKEVCFGRTKSDPVRYVSFGQNGLFVAAAFRGGICLWNTQTMSRMCLQGQMGYENWVAFSPDGNRIASSADDGTVKQWDVESGKRVGISREVTLRSCVAFTSDGERIISGSLEGVVRIWDAGLDTESEDQMFGRADGHTRAVREVSISQNGLRVASASVDHTVRVWDAQTGDAIGVPLEGHRGFVTCVSLSPDGRQVISGSDDATLRLWDTETSTQIGDPLTSLFGRVVCVSFSFDGLRIVSGSGRNVHLWNARTREPIGEPLKGHADVVSYVSESADGCHIVARDESRITLIWNRGTRRMVWKSESMKKYNFANDITDDKAEKIIRSCGERTPHLWPKSFPAYSPELYCEEGRVYTNLLSETTLVADIRGCTCWTYRAETKMFAAGLHTGAVAICKLIDE